MLYAIGRKESQRVTNPILPNQTEMHTLWMQRDKTKEIKTQTIAWSKNMIPPASLYPSLNQQS